LSNFVRESPFGDSIIAMKDETQDQNDPITRIPIGRVLASLA